MGARESKEKVNSNVEEEWMWLVGNCNPTDLGMRSSATPEDMAPGSEDQEGMAWMKEPMETWPCKKSFSPAPEELREGMTEGVCGVVKSERTSNETGCGFPTAEKAGIHDSTPHDFTHSWAK